MAWRVDWSAWPEEANFLGWHDLATEWQQEFQENIHPVSAVPLGCSYVPDLFHQECGYGWYSDPFDDQPISSSTNVGGHPLLIGASPPDSPLTGNVVQSKAQGIILLGLFSIGETA